MTARGLELSIAFQTDKTPAQYEALGRIVDRYGFDVVSVYNDLYFQPALGPLLHLARHVRHARLGPAALNPFTLHPIEIAGQIAVLDQATAGRAYLGLVRGSWLGSVGLTTNRAVTRLREAVGVVRYLLARQTQGYVGSIYQVAAGAQLAYEPLRSGVPIMIGTWGERTARMAATIAEEVKIGGSTNPRMAEIMRRWLGASDVGICLGAVTVVDGDREAARSLARRTVGPYLGVVAGLDPSVDDPEWVARVQHHAATGDYAALARVISDPILNRFAFAGTPEDIHRQVTELCAAGVSRVEFGTPHGLDPANGIRLLGEEVLPRVSR
jgi:5,10-methylenetetrahydromethanopterin reductase